MRWTVLLGAAVVGAALFATVTYLVSDVGLGPAALGGVAFAAAWIGAEMFVRRHRTRTVADTSESGSSETDPSNRRLS